MSKLRRFVRRAVWETAVTMLPALLIALFINVFIAEAAVVEDGPSMEPNLYRGYQMVTEKMSYHFRPPHRGDIVIVDPPGGKETHDVEHTTISSNVSQPCVLGVPRLEQNRNRRAMEKPGQAAQGRDLHALPGL